MTTPDFLTAAGNGQDRQRLMNSTWTHHIKTPFSQGWRVGNLVFTGGQLSADESKKFIREAQSATSKPRRATSSSR